ncbi:uncharacterized protein LOC141911521 [Tubulanus polymorphus]|uniref:uncharacterized protein LOC141911521 n=1 Tax=Tubulanus polymorphus TaxID=672921 RepID=UPI003DA47EF2
MWAEMKKSVSYKVDVVIDNCGVVVEVQCECGAGQGPNAHCKHVTTVLYAAYKFKEEKKIITEVTCTQTLQTFHRTKPHLGSPVKLLTTITDEEIKLIELNTRGQTSNVTWKREREMRITEFGTIAKATERKKKKKKKPHDTPTVQTYFRRARFNRPLNQSSTQYGFTPECVLHGQKYEKVAVEKYHSRTGSITNECGLFVSKDHPVLAASPDRVVNDTLILEVKCPFSAKDKEINPQTVQHLELDVNRNQQLKRNHDYFYQIQGQLYCSGRTECDFVVFTLKDIKIIHIDLTSISLKQW